jgi:uncharacterized protein
MEIAVDIHTHIWANKEQLGEIFSQEYIRGYGEKAVLNIDLSTYNSGTQGAKKTVLLAFRSKAIGLNVTNDLVSDTVKQDPNRIVGFGCVDPNTPTALEEILLFPKLNLKGLKLAPAYQYFDPWSKNAWELYKIAEELNLPILWHQGSTFIASSPLEYCRPILLDRIAREFPRLVMIVAHMGYPWFEETLALCRKHEQVFTDISALASRPFHTAYAFSRAIEVGVFDKLLFGSDFPFMTTEETLKGLIDIQKNWMRHPFKQLTDKMLVDLCTRDSLSILGIGSEAIECIDTKS